MKERLEINFYFRRALLKKLMTLNQIGCAIAPISVERTCATLHQHGSPFFAARKPFADKLPYN